MSALPDAIDRLLASISADEDLNGGLLSRDTLRLAGEARAHLAAERRRLGQAEPPPLPQPRQPKGALL